VDLIPYLTLLLPKAAAQNMVRSYEFEVGPSAYMK
jgi:hypothetical protein